MSYLTTMKIFTTQIVVQLSLEELSRKITSQEGYEEFNNLFRSFILGKYEL